MDEIYIKGLKIFAYHGVNPEETENFEKGYPFPSIGYFIYFSGTQSWSRYFSPSIVFSSSAGTKAVEYYRSGGAIFSKDTLLESSSYQTLGFTIVDNSYNIFYIKYWGRFI